MNEWLGHFLATRTWPCSVAPEILVSHVCGIPKVGLETEWHYPRKVSDHASVQGVLQPQGTAVYDANPAAFETERGCNLQLHQDSRCPAQGPSWWPWLTVCCSGEHDFSEAAKLSGPCFPLSSSRW